MDAVTLLRDARAAGLVIDVEGDVLRVRGPKEAESVALQLLEHKPDVMRALARQRVRTKEDADAVGLALYERILRAACGSRATQSVPVPPHGLSESARAEAWVWYWRALDLHRQGAAWPFPEPPAVTRVLDDVGVPRGLPVNAEELRHWLAGREPQP